MDCLLKLLKMIQPNPDILQSWFLPTKDFNFPMDVDCHHFCSNFKVSFQENQKHCPTCLRKRKVEFFANWNLSSIVQEKISNPEFMRGLKSKSHNDGERFIEKKSSTTNNLNCGINSDGVPMFKSRNISMWPIWMTYYDLPPNLRYLRSNIRL
eukprot:Pompholyxophrys_sp_v1_NODE_258_length_960_cov_1.838674.p1 type:complete len:153 gc:universal NODE_258_length_960_cov_1.838674:301-759(+)